MSLSKSLLNVTWVLSCFPGKRKDFEFNLSLQQSYGIYKISQECNCTGQESKSLSHHNLVEHPSGCCKFLPGRNQEMVCEAPAEISTTAPLDSSPRTNPHKDNTSQDKNTGQSLSGSPDGAEDKLTQEEGRKPELVDWEWYRSKSERTPRQVSVLGNKYKCRPVISVQ